MGFERQSLHRHTAGLALGILVALTAAACGSGHDVTSGVPTSTDGTRLPADRVVWQADTGGGLVPHAFVANDVPEVTIYGDGRVFLPVPAETDGGSAGTVPTAVRLVQGKVPQTKLRDFLDDVSASGALDESVDYGDPQVTDLPSTNVRLHGAGQPAEVDVYALMADFDTGLTGSQQASRRKLRDLIEHSRTLTGATKEWVPDRVEAIDLAVPEGAPSGDAAEWPGPPFIDVFGTVKPGATIDGPRCAELSGDDGAKAYAAALDAGRPFVDDRGAELQVVVRALLPGEVACERS